MIEVDYIILTPAVSNLIRVTLFDGLFYFIFFFFFEKIALFPKRSKSNEFVYCGSFMLKSPFSHVQNPRTTTGKAIMVPKTEFAEERLYKCLDFSLSWKI